MSSLKAPPSALHALRCVYQTAALKRVVPFRRSKIQSRGVGLSIDTDFFVPADVEPEIAPASPQSSGSQSPTSPSPPASEHSIDEQVPDPSPYYAVISAWSRDTALPAGGEANLQGAAITVAPNGARLGPGACGRQVLLTANPNDVGSNAALVDLLRFGLTRYATRLTWDAVEQKLVRTRMGGKKIALKNGHYAFVIDQEGDLLLSLAAAAQGGAPAGAHLNLAAGLPVLFAGELTVQNGAIVSYTPQSGSYRTPACLRGQAYGHPLLSAAQLTNDGLWQEG